MGKGFWQPSMQICSLKRSGSTHPARLIRNSCLDLILEPEVDTRTGNMEVKLIRDMNVLYTPITTTATEVLPNGGAAAWTCGDRVFAWKAYTQQDGQAAILFEEAIQRFRC